MNDEDTDVEIEIESCEVCGGIIQHELGCPKMDECR